MHYAIHTDAYAGENASRSTTHHDLNAAKDIARRWSRKLRYPGAVAEVYAVDSRGVQDDEPIAVFVKN